MILHNSKKWQLISPKKKKCLLQTAKTTKSQCILCLYYNRNDSIRGFDSEYASFIGYNLVLLKK